MTHRLQLGIAVGVAIVVVGFFFIFNSPLNLMDSLAGNTNDNSAALPLGTSTNTNELVVQDEKVGGGAEAKPGSTVTVNYTGKFQDGTVFDTSVGKNPFTFQLGAGMVIAGWDQGLQGMKVGGKRLLIIPPSLGYGSATYGPIPGNSTLVFEVELLDVK
ncbi:FKBP-type peptidyl-prolyl cis-trans isomerase [Candidatus Parcubacteria bacterium]|nr:FKBP-type peptidyl-prolyl cis-trans isomerase [Candidatus Parcubacteria bacterium]